MAEPGLISEDESEFDATNLSEDSDSISDEDDLNSDSGDILLDTDLSSEDESKEENLSEDEEEIQVRGSDAFNLLKGKGESLLDLGTAALGLFNLHELGEEDSPTPSSSRSWKDDQSMSSRSSILRSLVTKLRKRRKIKLAPNLQEFLGLETDNTWKPWKSTLREIENGDPTNEYLQFMSERVQITERSDVLLKAFLELYSKKLATKRVPKPPRPVTSTPSSPKKGEENIYKKVFDLNESTQESKAEEDSALSEPECGKCGDEYGLGVTDEADAQILEDMVHELEEDEIIDRLRRKTHGEVEVNEENYKKVMNDLKIQRLEQEDLMKREGMCPHQRERVDKCKFYTFTERNTAIDVLPNKCIKCFLENKSTAGDKLRMDGTAKKKSMNVQAQKSHVKAPDKTPFKFKQKLPYSSKETVTPDQTWQSPSKQEMPSTSQQAREFCRAASGILNTSKHKPCPPTMLNLPWCSGIPETFDSDAEQEDEEVCKPGTEVEQEIEEVELSSSDDENNATISGDTGASSDIKVYEAIPSSQAAEIETCDLPERSMDELLEDDGNKSVPVSQEAMDLLSSNSDANYGQNSLVTRDSRNLPTEDEMASDVLPNVSDFSDIVTADEISETYAPLRTQLTAMFETSLRISPIVTHDENEGEIELTNASRHSQGLDRKTSLDEDLELSDSDSSIDSDDECPRATSIHAHEIEQSRTCDDVELQVAMDPSTSITTVEPEPPLPVSTSTSEYDDTYIIGNEICQMLLSRIEANESIESSLSQKSLTLSSSVATAVKSSVRSVQELNTKEKYESYQRTLLHIASSDSEGKKLLGSSESSPPVAPDELKFNSLSIDEARRAALTVDLELSDSDSSTVSDSDSPNDEKYNVMDTPEVSEDESEAPVITGLSSPSTSTNDQTAETSDLSDHQNKDACATKEEIAVKYLKPFLEELPFRNKSDEIHQHRLWTAKEETRPIVLDIKHRGCTKRLKNHFASSEQMNAFMKDYDMSRETYRELLEKTTPILAKTSMDLAWDCRGRRIACFPKLIPSDTTNTFLKDLLRYVKVQPKRTYKASEIEGGFLWHDPTACDSDEENLSSSEEEEEEEETETTNQVLDTNSRAGEIVFNVSFYEPTGAVRRRTDHSLYDLNYFKCVFDFNEEPKRKLDLQILVRRMKEKVEGRPETDALKGVCKVYSKESARIKKIEACIPRVPQNGTIIGDFILAQTEWSVRNSKSVRDQCKSEESIERFLIRLKKMRRKIVAVRSGLAMDDVPEELLSVSDREEGSPDVNFKIDILSSSTLEDLCKTFKCFRGSEDKVLKTWKDMTKKRRLVDPAMEPQFMIIGSTVYCDTTNAETVAFVENLVQRKNLQEATGEKMVTESWKVSLACLRLRLGWPYNFVHRGSCEHHVMFRKTRVARPEELRTMKTSPRVRDVRQIVQKMCHVRLSACCKVAKFVTVEVGNEKLGRKLACFNCARYLQVADRRRSQQVTVMKKGNRTTSSRVDRIYKIYKLRSQITASDYARFKHFCRMRVPRPIQLGINKNNSGDPISQQRGKTTHIQGMMVRNDFQGNARGSTQGAANNNDKVLGQDSRDRAHKWKIARLLVRKCKMHPKKIKRLRFRHARPLWKRQILTTIKRGSSFNQYVKFLIRNPCDLDNWPTLEGENTYLDTIGENDGGSAFLNNLLPESVTSAVRQSEELFETPPDSVEGHLEEEVRTPGLVVPEYAVLTLEELDAFNTLCHEDYLAGLNSTHEPDSAGTGNGRELNVTLQPMDVVYVGDETWDGLQGLEPVYELLNAPGTEQGELEAGQESSQDA